MAELSIKIRGDISDLESKLKAVEATAQRAARGISTLFENSGRYAYSVSERAQGAVNSLRQMEQQAERSAAALRRLQIEQRGGGRIGGGVGGGINPTADLLGGFSSGSLGIGSVGLGAIGVGAAAGGYVLKESLSQTLDLSRANIALESSAKQAGLGLDAQKTAAAGLARELNINIVAATQLEALSTRLASVAGLGAGGGDQISTALANSLVAGGRSLNELPDRIRQLSTGQDELFDVIGGTNIGGQYAASPEQIYKATAAYKGLNRELTDTEKLQARVNTVLKIGGDNAGAAATQVQTMAGQWQFFLNDVLSPQNLDRLVSFATYGFASQGTLDVKAAEVGPAVLRARAEDAYKADLAKIDAFSAGVGVSAFGNVGRSVSATTDQRTRFGAFDRQAQNLEGQARLDAARFADEQLAERRRLAPGQILALQGQLSALNTDAVGRFRDIGSLNDRLADLTGRTTRTGEALGFYGQETGEGIYSTTFGETPQQKAARVFTEATALGAELFNKDPKLAATFARDYRLDDTRGINSADLTDAQRQTLREDIKSKQQEDRENAQRDRDRAARIEANIDRLTKFLTGTDDAPKIEQPVNINIKDQTSKGLTFTPAETTENGLFQNTY